MLDQINHYLNSWAVYRIDCELKAKGKAKINNEGWRKLRRFHFEQYLKTINTPFGFVFTLKMRYNNIYKQISGASIIYKKELTKKNDTINSREIYGNVKAKASNAIPKLRIRPAIGGRI